jgi:hypothetical protein
MKKQFANQRITSREIILFPGITAAVARLWRQRGNSAAKDDGSPAKRLKTVRR